MKTIINVKTAVSSVSSVILLLALAGCSTAIMTAKQTVQTKVQLSNAIISWGNLKTAVKHTALSTDDRTTVDEAINSVDYFFISTNKLASGKLSEREKTILFDEMLKKVDGTELQVSQVYKMFEKNDSVEGKAVVKAIEALAELKDTLAAVKGNKTIGDITELLQTVSSILQPIPELSK